MQCSNCDKLALRYGQISMICEDCFKDKNARKLAFVEQGVRNGTIRIGEFGYVDFGGKAKARSQESRAEYRQRTDLRKRTRLRAKKTKCLYGSTRKRRCRPARTQALLRPEQARKERLDPPEDYGSENLFHGRKTKEHGEPQCLQLLPSTMVMRNMFHVGK